MKTRYTPRAIGLPAATALLTLLLVAPVSASPTPEWRPVASERLITLPTPYLKKSLDHDYQGSALGRAVREAGVAARVKAGELGNLQAAIADAEEPARMQLRHQLLAEKRAYLDLTERRVELRRKGAETRLGLYREMLAKLRDGEAAETGETRALRARQSSARKRFESTLADVDRRLFRSTHPPESRYATKYGENQAAITKLMARLERHPMNGQAMIAGAPVGKAGWLREMVAETESELALLEQERVILGHMAKLVAFDALALSEEAMDAELADSDLPAEAGPAGAVNLFLTN